MSDCSDPGAVHDWTGFYVRHSPLSSWQLMRLLFSPSLAPWVALLPLSSLVSVLPMEPPRLVLVYVVWPFFGLTWLSGVCKPWSFFHQKCENRINYASIDIVPIVMAGIIAIYGLVVSVLIANDLNQRLPLYTGFIQLGAGLAVGLAGLAAGYVSICDLRYCIRTETRWLENAVLLLALSETRVFVDLLNNPDSMSEWFLFSFSLKFWVRFSSSLLLWSNRVSHSLTLPMSRSLRSYRRSSHELALTRWMLNGR